MFIEFKKQSPKALKIYESVNPQDLLWLWGKPKRDKLLIKLNVWTGFKAMLMPFSIDWKVASIVLIFFMNGDD